jgi:hypothetical protein
MSTNYERLTTQEDGVHAFTTSMLPLQIEEDGDLKRSRGLLPRLRAVGRVPRLALYFLALALGTIIVVYFLKFLLGITISESRQSTMTMDDIFDGSLSPRRHTIEWLPQCEFFPCSDL